jgi:hypothetical protein
MPPIDLKKLDMEERIHAAAELELAGVVSTDAILITQALVELAEWLQSSRR